MSPRHPRLDLGRGPTLLILALIVTVDVGLLLLRGEPARLATWWSSVGLGVGLLALSPLRRWPQLALAVFTLTVASAVSFGIAPGVAATIAVSHAAQAVCGAAVVTRLDRRRARLSSLPDLAVLVTAAAAGGFIALAIETVFRVDDVIASWDLMLQTGAQHALSILLFGAFLLSAPPGSPTAREGRRHVSLAVWVQSAALVAVLVVVFVPTTAAPLTFVTIPVLVWGAIAFEVRVAAGQLLLMAAVVILTTANGRGPFANGVVREDLMDTLTLAYLTCAALVALPLAVIVTQRRGLTERVLADQQVFRRTFTESPLGMVIMREAGDELEITEVNAAAERILGAPAADLEGRFFGGLVGSVDHHEHPFDALLAREVDVWHGQAIVLGQPDSRMDLAIAALAAVADSATGSARVFSAQLLDQTQESEARRRLEAAHRLTDTTLDTAACIIIVTDDRGSIVRINAATTAITGYDESTLVGSLIWEAPLTALTQSEAEAMFAWPNESDVAVTRERLSYTADGEPVRLVWNTNVVRDEAGIPSYAVLTGVDVTVERSSTGLMTHLLQASIGTALIGIDVSGRITVCSAGAAHLLGATTEEMLGQPFVGILDPSQLQVRTGAEGDREAFLCLIGMIGLRDESVARDWTWRTRNGAELIVSMTLSVTDDDIEDRVGFLCVGRDVTEQRQGQETLVTALDRERTAVERLRALDRAKDEFVSTVSHELRTPVTSILGYTELLLDGDVVEPDAQQAGMLETIARNSRRLIAICNDLLLLSGFESRDVLGNRETYDLREAIGVAEDFAKSACAQRSLTITFAAPDEAVMVSGDRSQLDRVFLNLVSNAIKFTEDHGRIDIRLACDETLGAIITVEDTGIGIHRDEQDLVFQRFYRTDAAQAMAIPGTGLGLPIISGIVDAHGGRIDVDSEPGEGTTFTVQLPVAPASCSS